MLMLMKKILPFVNLVIPTLELDNYRRWESRIVGGHNAVQGQFPYQVSLQGPINEHFCGGAIIGNRWVITTSSCVAQFITTPQTIRVRLGTHIHNAAGISHIVSEIRAHPNYNFETRSNDIATVQTQQTIVYNFQTQPIALSSIYTGVANAVVTGWGHVAVGICK